MPICDLRFIFFTFWFKEKVSEYMLRTGQHSSYNHLTRETEKLKGGVNKDLAPVLFLAPHSPLRLLGGSYFPLYQLYDPISNLPCNVTGCVKAEVGQLRACLVSVFNQFSFSS